MNVVSADLERRLDDLKLDVRMDALGELMDRENEGHIPPVPALDAVNMHCHTFFSFNAYGHSPTALAWIAHRNGWRAAGIVDFDVLDGVVEFLTACDRVGVRAGAGMETRVVLPEFADREINSPGEPGIAYHMGIGFTSDKVPERVATTGRGLRESAEHRNREMAARINAFLAPATIDYDRDILPLTPSGNATERHMLAAYVRAAQEHAPDPAAFWGAKLGLERKAVANMMQDRVRFQNALRAKLMKRGGAGYMQPGADTFPAVDAVNAFVSACGALPCATWLDGTSAGEQALPELLNLHIRKGAAALNIIPDRNWNIPDPEQRRIKVDKLYAVVDLARALDLPLIVGTEMNAAGQKTVDDFGAPELAPVRQAFLDGAYFVYGHTVLQRAIGLGYQSDWAHAHLPSRRERNAFYTRVGYATPPGLAGRSKLAACDAYMTPGEILVRLEH